MPCIDHQDYHEHQQQTKDTLSKRNDELAAELCELRSLILRLSKTAPARSGLLGPDLMDEMEEQIEKYRAHRELDKKRSLLQHLQQKKIMENNISKIKGLGGYPNDSLLEKLSTLTQKITDISSSDPLSTLLY